MANKLDQNSPGGLGELTVGVTSVTGEYYDITETVVEISLFESIYFPYIHGVIGVNDNSMMLSDFPFVGQERLFITWKRDDSPFTRTFFVTKVTNATSVDGGYGAYELTLSSVVQTRNSSSLFSKAYSDRGDKILKKVFSEQLGTSLSPQEGTQSKGSHSVVFPWMKPLQAVDMVQKSILGDDGTPMMIYDVLYENEIRLDTLKRMADRGPIMTIEHFKPSNQEDDGQAFMKLADDRGMPINDSIGRAYNTYDAINKGAFASKMEVFDPSTSRWEPMEFDYESKAPVLGTKDWLSQQYTVNGSHPKSLFDTVNTPVMQNSRAFVDEFPGLNTTDDYDKSIIRSYIQRHSTSVVKIYMDGISYTPQSSLPFCVGQTVEYNMNRFKPDLDNGEILDKVNSGKYIIASIRHIIQNFEHYMSIELVRDSVGEEAKL